MRNFIFSRPTIFFEVIKLNDNLLIARDLKKTIKYVEKNVYNFPNKYKDLKSNIINSCYDMLRYVYRANIDQNKEYKKMAMVEIKMLNFYLSQAMDKDIITKKKFLSYGKHLDNVYGMLSSWMDYEKSF